MALLNSSKRIMSSNFFTITALFVLVPACTKIASFIDDFAHFAKMQATWVMARGNSYRNAIAES